MTPERVKKYLASEKGKETRRAYRASLKGQEIRKQNHLDRFGLSLKEWEALFIKQNGLCAICGDWLKLGNEHPWYNAAVDHDHKTGKIRGLLCSRCNRGLGQFHDNLWIMKQAVGYLEG